MTVAKDRGTGDAVEVDRLFAVVGIMHKRRHDLAILRALGLQQRQIKASVLVACLVIVGPSAVIGISARAVLGRAYWTSVATGVPSIAHFLTSSYVPRDQLSG